MTQTTLDFDAAARARDAALTRVAANSGDTFQERARAFVLNALRSGQATGEALTEGCKAAGIVPHNDKAFGAVYGGLARAGMIEQCGYAKRAKGHCAPAPIWKLTNSEVH